MQAFRAHGLLAVLLAVMVALPLWQASAAPAAPKAAGKTKAKPTGCSRKVRVPRHRKKRSRRCKPRPKSLQVTFTPSGSPDKKTESSPAVESPSGIHPANRPSRPPDPAPVEEPAPVSEEPPTEAEEPPAPVEETVEEVPAEEPAPAPAPFRLFSPTSFWNAPIPAATPIDAESRPLVERLAAVAAQEIAATGGPAINTAAFSVPVYTVGPDQPTVSVTLRSSSPSTALRSAWSAVPLPPDAQPAAGTDHHLVVWQPSTDKLWEFWRLSGGPGSWEAGWGGAIERVSTSSGVYGADSWSGATRWWGASASSLSIAGGLITFEDLERGKIDHALAMALPEVRAGVYRWPAERSDGKSSNPLSLPEGSRLRLDPSLDLDALNLPASTRMIAEAAQTYGFVVRDGASTICIYGQDPTPTGTNPYLEPGGFLYSPRKPLAYFPWDHLQLLAAENQVIG